MRIRESLNSLDLGRLKNVPKVCRLGGMGFGGLGLAVGLLGAALGTSCSARVPFTEGNISAVTVVGDKQYVDAVTPDYLQNRNKEIAVVDWQSEGSVGSLRFKQAASIGKQPNSPVFELSVSLRGRQMDTNYAETKQAIFTIQDTNNQEQK